MEKLGNATPTIQKVAKKFCLLSWVDCTNIFGSYGTYPAKDHQSGAAIDIVSENMPEMAQWLENDWDLICVPHWNYKSSLAAIGVKGSHLHCTDKWWFKDAMAKKVIEFTTYNPEAGQTDSTPCFAGGTQKDICELTKTGVRPIALSQDLVAWTGIGAIKAGQKVILKSTDYPDEPRCNGEFEVWDSMNARFEDRGDIFMMDRKDNTSCHANVIMAY